MSVSGELVGARTGRGGNILRSRDRAALARIGVVAAGILAVLACLVALTVGAAGLSLSATLDALGAAATG
ncbi:MAG: iron ABC transporter, partial [Aurantimonas coralicida]